MRYVNPAGSDFPADGVRATAPGCARCLARAGVSPCARAAAYVTKTVRGIHQEMDKDLHSRTIAALGEDVVRAIQSSSVSPAAALPRPPPPPALRCPLASPPASGP
jgi:hypothetical protein